LNFSAAVAGSLATFLAELDVWRRKVNLTGQLSPDELARHTLESVLGGDLITHRARVVDVGSGAGFPGLPLAISRPDLDVTLVEPRAKRCHFLRHVIRELTLVNARVLEARIQDAGRTFDVATTRAVGAFGEWASGAAFLGPGGRVVAWATGTEALESALGPRFHLDDQIAVPGSERRRIAVFATG
jgi:16S rRNA (guanine527-N7)-methyltransferase